MRFSLVHPSRQRPQQAINTAKKWMEKCGAECEWILSLDTSDPSRFAYLELSTGMDFKVTINDNDCVVQAVNHGAKLADGDVLIYLSDDFDCPDNWGQLIINEIKTHQPGNAWLLKVDDCLQPFNLAICTLTIMSRGLYQILNYMYHPDFKSMFADEQIYWKAKNNGWLRLAPNLKFPHLHPSNGKAPNDETYIRSAKNWEQGKAMFAKHKASNFTL